MNNEPEKQEIIRNEDGTFPKGVSGNPKGRPKGKTLKEYQADKFRSMTDEQKEQWIIDNKISGIDAWRMAEGNPATNADIDLTSGGKPLPILNALPTNNSNQEDKTAKS